MCNTSEAANREASVDPALRRVRWDAVVAKQTSIDPRLLEARAGFCITGIERLQSLSPFAFTTNRWDMYFCDVGPANKPPVCGFVSPADLNNSPYSLQNQTPLSVTSTIMAITDPGHQQETTRQAYEAFEQGKCKALLAMATGTEFLCRLLKIEGIPDCGDIVRRRFEGFIASLRFEPGHVHFLWAVPDAFFQRRRFVPAEL